MIYSLLLKDGSSFSLNGAGVTVSLKNSMSLADIAFTKESNIVDRTYGDGSAKVGESRMAMNELTLTGTMVFDTDAQARVAINGLMYAFQNALFLIDETNALRTQIDLSTPSFEWEKGSYLRFGSFSIRLLQLVPFWESSVIQSDALEVDAGVPTEFSVTNEGYVETPFVVEVEVDEQAEPVAYVEIQNIAEGRVISVESPSFGIGEYKKLVVDCVEGATYLSNEVQGSQLDAQDSLQAGSGYFNLIKGINLLSVRCPVAATFTIKYRPRFYV